MIYGGVACPGFGFLTFCLFRLCCLLHGCACVRLCGFSLSRAGGAFFHPEIFMLNSQEFMPPSSASFAIVLLPRSSLEVLCLPMSPRRIRVRPFLFRLRLIDVENLLLIFYQLKSISNGRVYKLCHHASYSWTAVSKTAIQETLPG